MPCRPPGGSALQVVEERPWHRHWPEDIPKSLEYPTIPVDGLLRRAARAHPARAALAFYGTSISYHELDSLADRFAAGLRERGVRPGERVSLVLPNTPHFPVGFFGAIRAGAVVVQTNPTYTPRELENLFNDTGVETVIALDVFWPNLAKAKPSTSVKRIVVCDAADFLRTPLRQLYPIKRRKDLRKAGHWPLHIPNEAWVHSFKDVLDSTAEPGAEPAFNPDAVVVLQYTGGTTGTPKGAMLTHRNLIANAMQAATWLPDEGRPERVLEAVPMFHVYGLVAVMLAAVYRGNELILLPDPRDIRQILRVIHKAKPSVFPGVPTMYIAILRHPKVARYNLRSIRYCVSGAAPLPNEIRHEWEKVTGGRIVEGYGLTEASATHANPLRGLVKECIGIPLPDTDAKIVDPEDLQMQVATGEVGELVVRGPQVMKGYWNQPEETALVLRDGWLFTGDLAKMDEDGYFHIVERKKDMIVASGYKVYPREVEEVLFMHPSVAEAAAVGIPDPYRGETVKAFVVLKGGATVTSEEIVAFCRERLAPFKVPKQVEFAADLPKSVIGKILRRELRERGLRSTTSARQP